MKTLDVMDQIINSRPGTYLITHSGLVSYSDRWAYGYAVGIRPLEIGDIAPWTLVGVWLDAVNCRHYDLVLHVDTKQDALRQARTNGQQSIYSFRDEKAIDV